MTRFRIRILCGLGLVASAATICIATSISIAARTPKDAVCRGIHLSEWLQASVRDWGKSRIQPEDLRAVRPNPAAYIAHFAQRVQPSEYEIIGPWAPAWLRSQLPVSWLQPIHRGSLNQCDYALHALTWLGVDAEPAMPILFRFLDDPNKGIRTTAASAINGIGPASWPEVLRTLRQGSPQARIALLFTLPDRLSSPPTPIPTDYDKEQTVELLLQACRDPNPEIQTVAVGALGNCRAYYLGSTPLLTPAVLAMIDCIEHGKGSVCVIAARNLPPFGSEASAALPALKAMATDIDPFFRDEANQALARIHLKVLTDE